MRAYTLHIILLLCAACLCPAARAQINTEQVMRVGQNALYFEDYILSIQYFNQVINAKPGMAQPYLMRAIAKLNLDDLEGAEADASKAIEYNRFLTDAWEVRGVARQNLGKNEDAIKDYDEALKLLPRNRQMMFNRAMALCEVNDTARAKEAYAELLRYYPNFANGYLGRGRLRLQALADTLGAMEDIEHSLSLNPNSLNAYLMRAAISIESHKDYEQALADMDRAIKLEPRMAGLYINRAFLRHELVDYFGSMADYDYALMLEPLNPTALFNRSLLEMEVADYDKAQADLTTILDLDPDDYRARYNRAVVYGQKKDWDAALADINQVIAKFPDFSGAHYLRSEYLREKGQLQQAKAAYDKAWALAKAATNTEADQAGETPAELSPEKAAKRFNTLLTTKTDTPLTEEYNNEAIRGRVQDRNINIEMEPLIEISFYSSPTELRPGSFYIKDVDDINATRMLQFVMVVTPSPPSPTDVDMINRHFSSIEYYNSYLSTHTPRTIDYLGRAMDFITVKNYDAAILDMDRAIALTPDHSLAYLIRAQARYHSRLSEGAPASDMPGINARTVALRAVLDDYDKAIELQPLNAIAWYDKGLILFELGDFTSAIASFSRAIELQPSLGQAYYNRGYIYLKMGNQQAGVADLSKAGELGIIGAYNLIKRLRN